MKATITIEIEGSKQEIDVLTTKLSRFVGKQPQKIKLHPIKDMYPRGFAPKRRW